MWLKINLRSHSKGHKYIAIKQSYFSVFQPKKKPKTPVLTSLSEYVSQFCILSDHYLKFSSGDFPQHLA